MTDTRPTAALIDLGAFIHNLRTARRMAGGAEVMPVIKADGYGHGAVPLAQAAEGLGVGIMGVATVDEGLALREAGIRAELLVFGGFPPGAEEAGLVGGLAATVFQLDDALRLDQAARRLQRTCPVHLKIDTGMGRLGFLPAEAVEACRSVARRKNLRIDGLMTHYARSEESDAGPTEGQAALFRGLLEALLAGGLQPRYVHAANSGAILLSRGPMFNLVRAGIMLYGSMPGVGLGPPEGHGLRPVMTLKTSIIQLRTVPGGWPISYGGRWVTPGERKIAVLPLGYADGFLRYNHPGGEVLVRGRRAPVVGTVCMDLTMVDVTAVPEARLHDEVIIIGAQGDERILAEEVAARGKTISYEVFCGLSRRVYRHHLRAEPPAEEGHP